MTKQRQYTYQDHLDLFFNFRHKYSSERLLGVCRKYSEEKTATCLSGWWEFYSFQYGKYFFESVDEIFFFYSVRKMVREGQLTQMQPRAILKSDHDFFRIEYTQGWFEKVESTQRQKSQLGSSPRCLQVWKISDPNRNWSYLPSWNAVRRQTKQSV